MNARRETESYSVEIYWPIIWTVLKQDFSNVKKAIRKVPTQFSEIYTIGDLIV